MLENQLNKKVASGHLEPMLKDNVRFVVNH